MQKNPRREKTTTAKNQSLADRLRLYNSKIRSQTLKVGDNSEKSPILSPHLLKKFKEVINSAAGTKIQAHIMSFFARWLVPIFVPISCM